MKEISIIGQRIKDFREMTSKELEDNFLNEDGKGYCLVLENGVKIFASRDDEGNGPGTFFGETKEEGQIYLFPKREKEIASKAKGK